jgi:alkylation response protein AidB-like acyl-CoA dehydrogenase
VLGGSDAQKSEWLPKIAEGTAVGALAVDEGAHHNPSKVDTTFGRAARSLDGKKSFVLEGFKPADVLIVSAKGPGTAWASTWSVAMTPASAAPCLALADSRGAAHIEFKVAAAPSGADEVARAEVVEKVLDRASCRPLGRNAGRRRAGFRSDPGLPQGPRSVRPGHRLLPGPATPRGQDVHRSGTGPLGVEAALQAIDAHPRTSRNSSGPLAKAKMGDTFHLVSNEMVQMHGGIGMTDAHDAGFYLKRARAAEALPSATRRSTATGTPGFRVSRGQPPGTAPGRGGSSCSPEQEGPP